MWNCVFSSPIYVIQLKIPTWWHVILWPTKQVILWITEILVYVLSGLYGLYSFEKESQMITVTSPQYVEMLWHFLQLKLIALENQNIQFQQNRAIAQQPEIQWMFLEKCFLSAFLVPVLLLVIFMFEPSEGQCLWALTMNHWWIEAHLWVMQSFRNQMEACITEKAIIWMKFLSEKTAFCILHSKNLEEHCSCVFFLAQTERCFCHTLYLQYS